ncbi:hypothetical protein W97_00749 [Coniosporium apollinis CBS 100218]|uniref:Multiple myeloma tumor-associated protein 2-like N-terminal domain-containing protein n=1 Tax=Coniosporium apollinis (strain CBS 100218) TaxID=1168221 RepID=R7YI97_CONA1|nr:uncharacterized protein W97_00749 [Coniosporium apollinis CBS 100218]EON61534.1 hypothetical protein W97_00749 [Coniosporium apollinis CBS 100218]
MDLLQSVRKEGSRGGRTDFKWEDVKADQHRENYLGHSLMAPVGRWQKNKDLNWYAKGDSGQSAADARAEEIRRIKEAEEDAMAAALGLPVKERNNPNMAPLGGAASEADVKKAIAEATAGDEDEGGKGVGYKGYNPRPGPGATEAEVLSGERAAKTPTDGGEEDQGRAHDIGRGTAIGDTGRAHAPETGKGGGHEAEIIEGMMSCPTDTTMMGVVRTHEIEPTDAANVGVDPHTSVLILAHGGKIDGKKMEVSTIH